MQWAHLFLLVAVMLPLNIVYSRPNVDHATDAVAAVGEDRQILGGLSSLGALIQPLLFMIGVANFMGRIPNFFNRVRDRFSYGLGGTGAAGGAGRKRRSVEDLPWSEDVLLKNIIALRNLEEASEKYHRDS